MKYRSEVRVTGFMTVEVEADSAEEATEKALDTFADDCFKLPIGDLQWKTVDADLL